MKPEVDCDLGPSFSESFREPHWLPCGDPRLDLVELAGPAQLEQLLAFLNGQSLVRYHLGACPPFSGMVVHREAGAVDQL
jgi:hypothetical protein